MKIKIKRIFRHQETGSKVREYHPGVYDVPGDISQDVAQKVLKFGKAEVLAEKQAPENKVVKTPEDKTRVAKSAVGRRSTGTKPNK